MQVRSWTLTILPAGGAPRWEVGTRTGPAEGAQEQPRALPAWHRLEPRPGKRPQRPGRARPAGWLPSIRSPSALVKPPRACGRVSQVGTPRSGEDAAAPAGSHLRGVGPAGPKAKFCLHAERVGAVWGPRPRRRAGGLARGGGSPRARRPCPCPQPGVSRRRESRAVRGRPWGRVPAHALPRPGAAGDAPASTRAGPKAPPATVAAAPAPPSRRARAPRGRAGAWRVLASGGAGDSGRGGSPRPRISGNATAGTLGGCLKVLKWVEGQRGKPIACVTPSDSQSDRRTRAARPALRPSAPGGARPTLLRPGRTRAGTQVRFPHPWRMRCCCGCGFGATWSGDRRRRRGPTAEEGASPASPRCSSK